MLYNTQHNEHKFYYTKRKGSHPCQKKRGGELCFCFIPIWLELQCMQQKGLLCTLKLLSKGVKPKEIWLKHNLKNKGKNKSPPTKQKKRGGGREKNVMN